MNTKEKETIVAIVTKPEKVEQLNLTFGEDFDFYVLEKFSYGVEAYGLYLEEPKGNALD